MRRIVPEKLRDRIDGLDGLCRLEDGGPGLEFVQRPERENTGMETARRDPAALESEAVEGREAALRKARTGALMRNARAADAILEARYEGIHRISLRCFSCGV